MLSGGYNPRRALGSDLIAWWDADSHYWGLTGGMTIATGISSWMDIVAGYAATQATGSAQPVFSPAGFNGGPCVSFDGTDDILRTTDATLMAALPSGASPGELWFLGQQDALVADTNAKVAFSYGNSTGSGTRALQRAVVTGANRGSGFAEVAKTDAVTDYSTRHVSRLAVGATAFDLYIDGGAALNQAQVPATVNTRLSLGNNGASTPTANRFWTGSIVTAIVTKPLTDKAAALKSWLLNRRRL